MTRTITLIIGIAVTALAVAVPTALAKGQPADSPRVAQLLLEKNGVVDRSIIGLGETTLLESVFNLVLIPILLFSFLKDFDRLRSWARRILLQDEPQRVQLVLKADVIVSSYLRGILLTSSNVGLIATIVFVLFDIPFAVVIGILTGVFNLIPIFGMFLNLGVAMIIYLFSPGSFWEHTIITAATIAGLHALNSYIIEPRVIGERVGLHSTLVIAALFVFGYFLGFIGMLIAVPATAVLQMLLKEWYANMQARRAVDNAATLAISTTTPAV